MTSPAWLALLAPLPADEGECERRPMVGAPFAGWEEIRLVLGDGVTGLRIVIAIYDPEGRPGAVSDLVATTGGHLQETVGGRVEPDGRVEGTHWLTEGDQHTPRQLTDEERTGLRALAEGLRWRCPARSEA